MLQNHENYFPVKWEDSLSEQEEEEEEEEEDSEEEALSLRDLPLNWMHGETQQQPKKQAHPSSDTRHDDFDFDCGFGFGSNMCAADDVFSRGKMLPLRRPVPTAKLPPRNPTRFLSRSESVDSGSFSSASGTSSRSSSTRSVNSSNGSSAIPIARVPSPFPTRPSPEPQIRIPTGRSRSSGGTRCRKSTTLWETFRLGLVRTPEIASQDPKLRYYNIRNSSTCSNPSNSRNPNRDINSGRRKSFGNFFWSGCKCSIRSVEIPSKKEANGASGTNSRKSRAGQEEEEEKENDEEDKHGRHLMPRHLTRRGTRQGTFEWVEELSHAVGSYHSPSL